MNTDDLNEGEVNLFHTPERAQDALFEDGYLQDSFLYCNTNGKLDSTGIKLQSSYVDTREVQLHSTETKMDAFRKVLLDFKQGNCVDLLVKGNLTFLKPKNIRSGAYYTVRLTHFQVAATIQFDNAFLFPGGNLPQLSQQPDSVDILSFYSDGSFLYGALLKDFKPCS